MGIEGREIADKKAKSHAKTPPNITTQQNVMRKIYLKWRCSQEIQETQSLSNAKRLLKSRKDEAWQQEWQADLSLGAAKTYWDLGLKPTTRIKSQPELGLKREVLGWLIAARSGHGHFADYHERFGQEETDLRCECGYRRTQLHPFSCPNARPHRDKITSNLGKQLSPDELLGTPEGIKKFSEWALATGLFRQQYGVWSGF